MEMRGREDMRMGEDLTPPLPPLAASLYHSTLSSHCSACFSPLRLPSFTPPSSPISTHAPSPPPPPFLHYCSPACSSLDSPLHFSSAESHLLRLSPPHSADLRLSLRLLHHSLANKLTNDGNLERIGGLMTNRERLFSTREECLRNFVGEDDEDDDFLERIRSAAKAMAAARRRMRRGGSGEEEEVEEEEEEEEEELVLCTAFLCLVMTNAVEVQDKSGRGIGVAVYDTTFSWINHSCSPNACYRFSTRLEEGGVSRLRISPAAMDGCGEVVDKCARGLVVKGREGYGPRMIVRSIKAIRKGEEVTIAYTDLLQPKAMRQSELWLKYRFDCLCKRCTAVPLTCVDQNLQEIIALDLHRPSSVSDHNFHKQEMIRNLRDCYDDAVAEYLSYNNARSCCQKLENLLIRGQSDKHPNPMETKSELSVMLHPFHHLSLNAYMILASAYKVQANDLLDPNSETEEHHTEAFNLMRVSAAYSLMLAGATHHLLRSEASLIVSVASFWTSAGESLLQSASSQIWDSHLKGPPDTGSSSLLNYKFCKCSLLDRFRTARVHSQDQDMQYEDTISQCLSCIVDITSKLWTSLIHGRCYLKVVKDPIDFRWLTTIKPFVMFYLETRHISTHVKNSVSRSVARESNNTERIDLMELGIHCLLYGAFLSSICYGQNSHLICNVEDILGSKGILLT